MREVFGASRRFGGFERTICIIGGLAAIATANASALSQQDQKMSDLAIAWASQNIATFKAIQTYAHNAPKPEVPVPPIVDQPCHVCGDATQTQGEAQVEQWVKQSQEPEAGYIRTLAQMSH